MNSSYEVHTMNLMHEIHAVDFDSTKGLNEIVSNFFSIFPFNKLWTGPEQRSGRARLGSQSSTPSWPY